MKETSYYELKMPDSNDTIDVSVLNNNMKRLDDVLILTVIGRNAETSEFVKKCCAPYIMIQNLGEETVTIYDRRWPEDMWEDNKIVIEPTKFYTYRVANNVNANFLVLDNKECNFRYFITAEQAIAEGGGGGGGGTTDYNELDNQPKINGFTLVGNKSFKELGLLNDDGKIKSDYLPPFVDNMDSYDKRADFPAQGEEDKLYLDKSTNLAYVWAGSDYACIGTPLALGITHETAGYGDESRAAYNHSLSEHARVDATKTEASSVNGKIKINGTDVDVYTHPQAEGQETTNPHGTTASDVGLGNLLNAKQVTVTEQAYSETEKAQARNNIGAGTSSFSGKYSDLSEIPSEFTPAEHNHDDLYAHKTSVSSGENSTTSVINVTDAKAQMAMVASIKGKTVKKNFATPVADLKETTVNGVKFTPVFDSNGALLYINALGTTSDKKPTATNGATYTVSKVTNTVQGYTISAGLNGKSISGAKCVVELAESPWTSICVSEGAVDRTISNTMISGKTYNFYIQVLADTVADNIKFYPMIRPSGTDSTYQPPNTLWSAPVESVVSVGKNLISPLVNGSWNASNGAWGGYSTNYCANAELFKIDANKTFTVSIGSSAAIGIYCAVYYDKDKKWISSSNLDTSAVKTKTYTAPSNCEYVGIDFRCTSNITPESFTFVMCNYGSTALTYTPYNKTTVLVPSAVKNLPDYGLGIVKSDGTIVANEVDFENGVYYHRVSQLDLGTLTWDWSSSSSRYYVRPNTKIKPTVGSTDVPNVLCPLYTTTSDGTSRTTDKTVSVDTGSEIVIKDTSKGENKLTEFKAAMNGVMFIYELADSAKKTIPLTDYIRPLPVENGGTLTLVNEHNLDVNSTIKYKKEV